MNIANWQLRCAERFPASVALVFGTESHTNAQLLANTRRLATGLLELGLRPGDRVALAVGNTPVLYLASHAIYFAGLVLVILPQTVDAEIAKCVAECQCKALVGGTMQLEAVQRQCEELICISSDCERGTHSISSLAELLDRSVESVDAVARSDSDVAQLSYTSGTSGVARAAVFTHGALNEFLRAQAERLPKKSTQTTVLVGLPPTAFAGRVALMRTLGDQCYVLMDHFSPAAACRLIEQHRVALMPMLPTMAEQMAAAAATADCTSLQGLSLSGARVASGTAARLQAALSGGRRRPRGVRRQPKVTIHYGMTEVGGGIASTEGLPRRHPNSVGGLVPGVDVRICDESGLALAAYAVGEIEARAPYMACGYWNDPDRSAMVFRDGWVRTGDLGFLTQDGELCLVGRQKEVINQAGVKVLPLELAAQIEQVPGVLACVAVGMENDLLGEEVIACVVRTADAEVSERDILSHCRKTLDSRKSPARIEFMDTLPQTQVGKYDIQALRAKITYLDGERKKTRLDNSLGWNQGYSLEYVTQTVTTELRDLLHENDSGAIREQATFGELGLDSIGAVRLAHRLSNRLGVPFSATLVYTYPTVGQLCAHVTSVLWPDRKDKSVLPMSVPHIKDAVGIVGISCRVAGAATPNELWDLLAHGRSTISEAPPERRKAGDDPWYAGFVDSIAEFDAKFFRLESLAARLDPRIRMLLELAWEGLEDAGINPLTLSPERTGVFLGISGEKYDGPDPLTRWPGMAVGYLCQFLDLRGPVVTVDTTCSSSLVALHNAMQSLNANECDTAIVAGANLLTQAGTGMSRAFVSPRGRSRAFDTAADGFGQGEGCVVLILQRTVTSTGPSSRIYASVLGSAINHDGRSSSLTAPNPRSQTAVIEQAMHAAGVTRDDVQYVEAHGTGTLLGDVIEVEALAKAFEGRTVGPLTIGSIKTNIGHLEAGAGLAGVAKVALSIERKTLVPSLGCDRPNPKIPWERIPIRVQSIVAPWPSNRPMIGAISSFGMSGTNAHAILGSAPSRRNDEHSDAPASGLFRQILPISARSPTSLHRSIKRMIAALQSELRNSDCSNICFTAANARAHLEHRVAVFGDSHEELIDRLQRTLSDLQRYEMPGPSPSTQSRQSKVMRNGPVMVFCDAECPAPEMGRLLFKTEPVFRTIFLQCHAALSSLLGRQTEHEFDSDTVEEMPTLPSSAAHRFAYQVALTRLWAHWGVVPAAVIGHGAGEVSAAHVAGRLSLIQAAELLVRRRQGNAATPTVAADLVKRGSASQLPMFSSMEGDWVSPAAASNWDKHAARGHLNKCIRSLSCQGYRAFLAIGPGAVALDPFTESSSGGEDCSRVFAPLAHSNELESLRHQVCDLYGAGVDLEWSSCHPTGKRVRLPTYAWDHARYWHGTAPIQILERAAGAMRTEDTIESAIETTVTVLTRSLAARSREDTSPRASLAGLGVDTAAMDGIRGRLAKRLGLAQSMERANPEWTIGELIDRILLDACRSKASENATERVVFLKHVPEAPLCVWIHPIGGAVACYRQLANSLPFSSVGVEVTAAAQAHDSIPDLADRYIKAIEALHVNVPLILGGWSFGGLVAHEMAIRFASMMPGRTIPLILMDSYLLSGSEEPPPAVLMGDGTGAARPAIGATDVNTMRTVLAKYGLVPPAVSRSSDIGGFRLPEDEIRRLYAIFAANYEMARKYHPANRDGSALVIAASGPYSGLLRCWLDLASNAEWHEIDADHYSMMRSPAISKIATSIADYLGKVSRSERSDRLEIA